MTEEISVNLGSKASASSLEMHFVIDRGIRCPYSIDEIDETEELRFDLFELLDDEDDEDDDELNNRGSIVSDDT